MDPLQILLETASRRLGAAQAQQLVDALRAFIGDARARSWAAWLGRRGFWSDFAMQAIASLRPGAFLARRRTLPAGITAAQVDELWEEFVEGVHRGLAALPAPGAPAAAPVAGAAAAPPPPAPLGWGEEMGVLFQELPRVLVARFAGVWPYLACGLTAVGLAFALQALKAARQSERMLGWFDRSVVLDARPALRLATIVVAGFVLAIIGTAIRSVVTAPAGRWFHRGRLVWPVVLALVAIPTTSFALAGAIDVAILTARISGAPLHLVLPFIARADRYALVAVILSFAGLMTFTGLILAIDSMVDIGALLLQKFSIGKGNIPLERVASTLRGFGLAALAVFCAFHLAVGRWPSAQQVADFLLFGLGLLVLSGIILAWVGISASERTRRWVAVGFVAVVSLATLWVWYNTRHHGVVEGAASDVVVAAQAPHSLFERACDAVVAGWWGLVGMNWLPGTVLGAVAILLFARAIERAGGGSKNRVTRLLWGVGVLPTAYVVAGIVAGWLPVWAAWRSSSP